MINKLEKQLTEERSEREKMRNEIEELKKINSQLTQTIIGSNPPSTIAAAVPGHQSSFSASGVKTIKKTPLKILRD